MKANAHPYFRLSGSPRSKSALQFGNAAKATGEKTLVSPGETVDSAPAWFFDIEHNPEGHRNQLLLGLQTQEALNPIPDILMFSIGDPQRAVQGFAITIAKERQLKPDARTLLIRTTLMSPDGTTTRYPRGQGKHTIGMKVDLNVRPAHIYYIDPWGFHPLPKRK